jgi:hypothetical protein
VEVIPCGTLRMRVFRGLRKISDQNVKEWSLTLLLTADFEHSVRAEHIGLIDVARVGCATTTPCWKHLQLLACGNLRRVLPSTSELASTSGSKRSLQKRKEKYEAVQKIRRLGTRQRLTRIERGVPTQFTPPKTHLVNLHIPNYLQ